MQSLEYLHTVEGIVWLCVCVVMGFAMTALAYLIINRIPAKWLCDYNETPSEELLSGKRISYLPTAPVVSVLVSAALVMCRLQFNKGFDVLFLMMALVIMCCLLIAISDLKYQIIPDQFTVALGVFGLLLSLYDIIRGFGFFHHGWWSPLAGAAMGAAAMIGIDLLAMVIYHREGMGFGDVKLFAAIGLLTGFPGTIYTLILSVLTATVFFVAIIVISKIRSSGEEQPQQQTDANNTVIAESDAQQDAQKEKQPDNDDTTPDSGEPENIEAGNNNENEETGDTPQEKGFGSYLAFGPYIAAALIVYLALYDQIGALVGMYLDLFK